MSDMPERIWLPPYDGKLFASPGAGFTQYVRADLVAELVKALEQARLYIERDEVAHGRQFGDGNAVRAALSRIAAKGGE